MLIEIKKEKLTNYLILFNKLIKKIEININQTSLNLLGISEDNIIMLNLEIPKSEFINYNYENCDIKRFCINSTNLFNKLKLLGENIKFSLSNNNILEITDNNNLILLNLLENKKLSIPNIETDVSFSLDTKEFLRHITELNKIGDNIIMKTTNHILCLEIENFVKIFPLNQTILKNPPAKSEIIKSVYELAYLNKLKECKKINLTIIINFKNNFPLILEVGYLKIYLANIYINQS